MPRRPSSLTPLSLSTLASDRKVTDSLTFLIPDGAGGEMRIKSGVIARDAVPSGRALMASSANPRIPCSAYDAMPEGAAWMEGASSDAFTDDGTSGSEACVEKCTSGATSGEQSGFPSVAPHHMCTVPCEAGAASSNASTCDAPSAGGHAGARGSASTGQRPSSTGSSCTQAEILYEDLAFGDRIDSGSTGRVFGAQHKVTKQRFALKYIRYNSTVENRKMLDSELSRVLTAPRHKNIVTSYQAFFNNGELAILMELMDAYSMEHVMKRNESRGLPEKVIAYVTRELLCGLAHLNSYKTCHRDVKPSNILTNTAGEVKLSDFGIAKTFTEGASKTLSVVGTKSYLSPEMFKMEGYSYNCDIWSVGISIAEIAIGAYPIEVENPNSPYDLHEIISSGHVDINWGKKGRQFSKELKNFVRKCLQPHERRPLAQDLLDSNDPFLQLAEGVTPQRAAKWFVNLKDQRSNRGSAVKSESQGES